jgi:hypothetical protein
MNPYLFVILRDLCPIVLGDTKYSPMGCIYNGERILEFHGRVRIRGPAVSAEPYAEELPAAETERLKAALLTQKGRGLKRSYLRLLDLLEKMKD